MRREPKRREEGPRARPRKLLPATRAKQGQLSGQAALNCSLEPREEGPAKQAQLLGLLNCSLELREEGPVIRPLKLLPETPAKQA